MIELIATQFPYEAKLNDGTPCVIRRMDQGDETDFREFHQFIPDEEQLFIKSQIKDGSLFRDWMAKPDDPEHLALFAIVDGGVAAMGSLHQRMGGWKRHIGKVYFLTHPDYKGLGLIDILLESIVRVSTQFGLTKLESELNGERLNAIDSMSAAGFKELVRLPNYIRDMKAESHDYVLMGINLVASYDNLGAGD